MKKTAFTLIELMLVVVILGVLASLVVPRLAGRAEKARRSAAKADVMANIPSALDLFDMDVGKFPANLEELVKSPAGVNNWDGPYIKRIPKDPWGNDYEYRSPGEHSKDYDLSSKGKDGIAGTDDDIKSWE